MRASSLARDALQNGAGSRGDPNSGRTVAARISSARDQTEEDRWPQKDRPIGRHGRLRSSLPRIGRCGGLEGGARRGDRPRRGPPGLHRVPVRGAHPPRRQRRSDPRRPDPRGHRLPRDDPGRGPVRRRRSRPCASRSSRRYGFNGTRSEDVVLHVHDGRRPGAREPRASPASTAPPAPGERTVVAAAGRHAQDGPAGVLRPRDQRAVAQLRLRHGDVPLLRPRRVGGDPRARGRWDRARRARSTRSRRPRSPAARSRSGSAISAPSWRDPDGDTVHARGLHAGRVRVSSTSGPRVYAALTHPLVRVAPARSRCATRSGNWDVAWVFLRTRRRRHTVRRLDPYTRGLGGPPGALRLPLVRALGRGVVPTPERQAEILATMPNAIVATIRPDGVPQLTPNWYLWTGEAFWISTAASDRSRPRNLRRDPRIVLCIDDVRWRRLRPGRRARAILVEGDAAREPTLELCRKYMPAERGRARTGRRSSRTVRRSSSRSGRTGSSGTTTDRLNPDLGERAVGGAERPPELGRPDVVLEWLARRPRCPSTIRLARAGADQQRPDVLACAEAAVLTVDPERRIRRPPSEPRSRGPLSDPEPEALGP